MRGARIWGWALAGAVSVRLALGAASAKTAVNCVGAALLGAAQLLCSHVDPKAAAQLCTFRWELATSANQVQLAQGSFLIPPGASNVQVYSAAGFARAVSPPIVLCQGRKGLP